MIPIALTVAGSDSSGGAGIQADLKTFSRLKVYGMSVITALTAQNTAGVDGVMEVAPEFVARQFDAVVGDIRPHAVKTGMLVNTGVIRVVADRIRASGLEKLVVDPVMISTSGVPLLQSDAFESLKRDLLPLALLLTPNTVEATSLTGVDVRDPKSMEEAARRLHDLGVRCVLIKGGHLSSGDALDVLLDESKFEYFHAERIHAGEVHGTGCVLSAAITAHLAMGKSIVEAVRQAKELVTEAIRLRLPIGKGASPAGLV